MEVCHHKIAGILLLQFYIVAHGTKIVSQVQEACRPDPAHNDRITVFHPAKIINVKEGMKPHGQAFHSSIKSMQWSEMD
jgi:hypothetical protein